MTVVADLTDLFTPIDSGVKWLEVIGSINGSNKIFAALEDIGDDYKDFVVSHNGQILNYDADYVFSAPRTVTFIIAPLSGDYIKIIRLA